MQSILLFFLLYAFQLCLASETNLKTIFNSILLLQWKSITIYQDENHNSLMKIMKNTNLQWKINHSDMLDCSLEYRMSWIILLDLKADKIEKCLNEAKQSFNLMVTYSEINLDNIQESVGYYHVNKSTLMNCYITVRANKTSKICTDWNNANDLYGLDVKVIRGMIPGDSDFCQKLLESLSQDMNFSLSFTNVKEPVNWGSPTTNYSDYSQYTGKN